VSRRARITPRAARLYTPRMSSAPARRRLPVSPATLLLVAGNLVPAAGVLRFDWTLQALLVAYWLENLINGGFNVARMAAAARPVAPMEMVVTVDGHRTERRTVQYSKARLVALFTGHYSAFMLVHGIMLAALFGPLVTPRDGLGWFLGAMGAGYLADFLIHFLREGEYRAVSPTQVMIRPYGRLVVVHLTIMAGGLVAREHRSAVALTTLVVTKTALDLIVQTVRRRA
jgi:hypothetical protein